MPRPVAAVVVVALLITACGDAAETVATEDRRPTILGQLGGPDSFLITAAEHDGKVARLESWRYFDSATQIDFVDGEVLWSVAIDPPDDGTVYPRWFDPAAFVMLSSPAAVRSSLLDLALTEIDPDNDAVPGAVLLAGDQLLLGFVANQLVYVETFPLAPDEARS